VGTTDGDAAPVSVPLGMLGFTVLGIPHILDSVVLTGLSFDVGLLGSHIAVFCSGVNDDDDDDDDGDEDEEEDDDDESSAAPV
jgi:hypothetical protein